MDSINSNDINLSLNKLKPLNLKDSVKVSDDAGQLIDGFGSVLKNEMNKINTLQANANSAVQTYASGGNIELHNVIASVEKASMNLELAVQVRNRLISGYQELWRMQI